MTTLSTVNTMQVSLALDENAKQVADLWVAAGASVPMDIAKEKW
jgi:hypothetical protein